MRLLAHISDPHFGTEVPGVVSALTRDLKELAPQVILVSGDVTQRARKYQFARAAAFLNQFPAAKLVVPGNHDLPLFNLYRRLINPLSHYHFFFPAVTESDYQDDELMILGLNSARRLRLRRGQFSRRQIEHLRKFFCGPDRRFRIFMSHHPVLPIPEHFPRDLVFRRKPAVRALAACNVELVLGGHAHRLHVDNLQEHYPFLSHPMVVAQAGTAVSRRAFRRPQAYNLIRVHPEYFTIETRIFKAGRFVRHEVHKFKRKD